MRRNLTLLIGLLLAANPLVAQYYFLEPPLYELPPEEVYEVVPVCPTPCVYTTPAPQCLPKCSRGLYFFGEYLYWKADQDNLEYCTVDLTPDSSSDAASTPPFLPGDANGQFHCASLKWTPGVRGGLGIPLAHDNWELLGIYTYHYSDGRQEVDKPSASNLFLNGNFRENLGAVPQRASSNINLKFQQGDVLLSRKFDPSGNIFLKMTMGLAGAWFEQFWTVKYSAPTTEFAHNTSKVHNNWQYYGGGGRLGLDLDWNMGRGISFYGRFSGAVLLGRYKFHYYAHNPNTSALPTGYANFDELRYVPNTQVGLGFKWFGCIFGANMDIQLGYELNSWWNVHMLPVTPWIPAGQPNSEKFTFHRNGNVCFQGFTGRVGFNF